jgi:nucleoside-diphosphate-sugar epimerase
MEGRSIADYPVNVQGVTNLLAALRHVPMMERLIVTSSQHVRRPGSPVTLDPREYAPHMSYGESKVATEELVRAAALAGCWTIIRPTNVWGMGHPYLVDGLWRLIHKGAYVHPMGDNVVRGYGFVDNVCWQIEGLLTAPAARVSGRMFYVGDQNERQIEWIDAFGIGLTGRKVRRVPRAAIKMLAHVGDVVHRFGANFPMHSARFSNLTTENRVPMDEIHALLGTPPTTWREAVVATCRELKTHYNRRR